MERLKEYIRQIIREELNEATMNAEEMTRHKKKLEKLKKILATQGDQMMAYPKSLPNTVLNAKLITKKITEDLRDWFGTGGKGGVGGGGWDRYNSSGDRIGKCGDAKEGEAYSACLSKEKAEKLGKEGRAAFVKRKRAAQKKGGDAKKGGERKKGQKPIKVKTGVKESISFESAYNKIDSLPQGKIFDDAKRIDGIFNKSKHSYSDVIEAYEKNKNTGTPQIVSVKDIHITQPNIQSNKVKQTITSFDDTAPLNVVQFPDGEMAIYDGHHRLTAAWAMGKDKIKVNLVKPGVNESTTNELVLNHIGDNEYVVKAMKGGREVGKLNFIKSKFKPVLKATIVTVDPAYRRQGIGSSMYVYAEKELGMKFVKSDEVLTPDGKSIWNDPNRKFGLDKNAIEKRLNLFLEKNIPTKPDKWSYYKSQAKKKFDVYPSAYANAWAAKKYKKAGGGWRKSK